MPEGGGAVTRLEEDGDHPKVQAIEPFTCVACGCLCDDVQLVIDDKRIVAAQSVCDMGRSMLVGWTWSRR